MFVKKYEETSVTHPARRRKPKERAIHNTLRYYPDNLLSSQPINSKPDVRGTTLPNDLHKTFVVRLTLWENW